MSSFALPKDSAESTDRADAARTFGASWNKAIKQIAMYRHAQAKYPEFLTRAHEALTAFGAQFGVLQLKVDQAQLAHEGQPLLDVDSPIPYRLFKEGIRQVLLRPGASVDEFVRLTTILLSDPDRGDEELNTQLWREQLPHVEYIMVASFRMDEFSEEQVEVEVGQVVDALQQRLRSDSDDFVRFARVGEDDVSATLNDVEQLRGVVVTGLTATDALKAKVQSDIHAEENQRLFPKLLTALFQSVESGIDDTELLLELFTQLLDIMLLQEDFAIIGQVLGRLRALEAKGPKTPLGKLAALFVGKMAEEQRLSRLGDVLRVRKPKSPQDVARYLAALPASAAPMLVEVLDGLDLADNRTLLADALVPFAKATPDAFVARLDSPRPQLVRDMVYVLDRANVPDKVRYFARVMQTDNLANKLEVLSIIAKGRTVETRAFVVGLLDDPQWQVRAQAARVLPEFDRERAFVDLMRLVADKGRWEQRTPAEREAFYAAIGITGVPSALQYFTQLLSQKSGLFDKKRITDEKLLAVAGLASAATIQAAKLLQDVVDDRSQPSEVVNAAKVQLAKVKRALMGGG